MSIREVRDLASSLPHSLAAQVIGYAESVEHALPEIFRESRLPATERLSDDLVLLAGLKKLHWLAASSYWTLEHSGRLLASLDIPHVRIGRMDVSVGGDIHAALGLLLAELDAAMGDKVVALLHMSWTEVIERLQSER